MSTECLITDNLQFLNDYLMKLSVFLHFDNLCSLQYGFVVKKSEWTEGKILNAASDLDSLQNVIDCTCWHMLDQVLWKSVEQILPTKSQITIQYVSYINVDTTPFFLTTYHNPKGILHRCIWYKIWKELFVSFNTKGKSHLQHWRTSDATKSFHLEACYSRLTRLETLSMGSEMWN